MKRALISLTLLFGFGLFKAPREHRLFLEQRQNGYQLANLNLSVRAQLGQTGFVAALSGFRALMADLLWIRSGAAFERTEWSRMELLLHSATQLQPRAVIFWEMAHFHMAYDAATAMKLNTELQPVAALRRKAEQEYVKIGERFLLDGISFNPESSQLWQRLGDLYSRRMLDHAKAAEAYDRGSKLPGAMTFLRRFAAYELAQVEGREKEAYERLKALFLEGDSQRHPRLLHLLGDLEQKLAVPTADRVYIKSAAPQVREP